MVFRMESGLVMGRFDKGCTYYTVASCEIEMYFPEDCFCCQYCKFLKHYDSINRDRCILTDEILISRDFPGVRCPLVKINEIKTEEIEK